MKFSSDFLPKSYQNTHIRQLNFEKDILTEKKDTQDEIYRKK
jgi:hypothetical protein